MEGEDLEEQPNLHNTMSLYVAGKGSYGEQQGCAGMPKDVICQREDPPATVCEYCGNNKCDLTLLDPWALRETWLCPKCKEENSV